MIYIFAAAFNMGWGPVCKFTAAQSLYDSANKTQD